MRRNLRDYVRVEKEDCNGQDNRPFYPGRPEKRCPAFSSELDAAEDAIWGTLICNPAAPRDKQGLYSRLDQLDDLREVKSHNVYTKFISRLDASQQDALTTWLADEKEGFYSRTAEHESMFEGVNVDVVTHVDAVCAEQAKKQRG